MLGVDDSRAYSSKLMRAVPFAVFSPAHVRLQRGFEVACFGVGASEPLVLLPAEAINDHIPAATLIDARGSWS